MYSRPLKEKDGYSSLHRIVRRMNLYEVDSINAVSDISDILENLVFILDTSPLKN